MSDHRYYKDSHKILGNTYGMCVLQDFEAITPNLLARTIETVEGGGLVILLLKTMTSLRQLYTMTMVHSYPFSHLILTPHYRMFMHDIELHRTMRLLHVSMNASFFLLAHVQIVLSLMMSSMSSPYRKQSILPR